jgi:two-component system, LytTR family, response regulator
MTFTCIVVDDEPLITQRIAKLASAEKLDVLATCASGDEAIAAIAELKPNIVFLDIQMPGTSGLDVIKNLGVLAAPPVCILVTAFDQYAAAGFALAAVDYVLKPVSRERFHAAVERAILTINQRDSLAQIGRLRGVLNGTRPDKLTLRDGAQIVQFTPGKISRIEAADDYCLLYEGNNEHLVSVTLTALERLLPTPPFVRCHRSHLVNLDHLESFKTNSSGGATIRAGGTEIPVSRASVVKVRALLQG